MTRIIRAPERQARQPNPERPRLLRAAQVQAQQDARQLREQAQAQALALLDQARADAQALQQAAREAGQAQAAALLVAARQQALSITQDAEAELTRLAVRIAEKLLGEQLQLHPESVTLIARQLLSRSGASQRLVLRVHPDDQSAMEQALPRLARACEAGALLVRPDSALLRGDCVLETDLGEVDGRLQAQLQAIEEALCQ